MDFVGTPAHDYGPKPCLAWANKLEQRMTNLAGPTCIGVDSMNWMVESWASANFQTTFSGNRISGINSPDVKSLQLLDGRRLFDLTAF